MVIQGLVPTLATRLLLNPLSVGFTAGRCTCYIQSPDTILLCKGTSFFFVCFFLLTLRITLKLGDLDHRDKNR